MLREMTDPAFAHSFKRFAQCVVAGLALAGLAACGGGGSSTPAETTPTTPTPEPTPTPIPAPTTPDPTPAPAPSSPPEIPITPPPGSTQACLIAGADADEGLCVPDTDCSGSKAEDWRRTVNEFRKRGGERELQFSSQEVQQCPRSGSEYTAIAECRASGDTPAPVNGIRLPANTTFWYGLKPGVNLESEGEVCEAAGFSWHVHQQPSS